MSLKDCKVCYDDLYGVYRAYEQLTPFYKNLIKWSPNSWCLLIYLNLLMVVVMGRQGGGVNKKVSQISLVSILQVCSPLGVFLIKVGNGFGNFRPLGLGA